MPKFGLSSPRIIFMTVVLPAPLPPKRARVWLAAMSKEMFSTAKSLPKNLLIWDTFRICWLVDPRALFSVSMGAGTLGAFEDSTM